MASVTINGTVKVVGTTQKVSEKFSKRELVVSESGTQFPQLIPVEFTQGNTSMLDGFAPGDEVTVTCFVNGREWTRDGVTKYFLSLKGDRIEKTVGRAQPAPVAARAAAPPPPSIADLPQDSTEDDLPF